MNSTVQKDVIDALGGIQDTVRPLEKSLREHEMRPFDIEPNYYEELMLSRNLGSTSKKDRNGVVSMRNDTDSVITT